MDSDEKSIRAMVRMAVESFSLAFAARHVADADYEEGALNMKMHNVFIAALGPEILYYSALVRSLESSLGSMLEKLAVNIARLHYEVSREVVGSIGRRQIDFIAELLESYKNTGGANHKSPRVEDYRGILKLASGDGLHEKRHASDYCLYDPQDGMHYLIALKVGGDFDNKKARSEKEALLDQYCLLANSLGSEEKIRIYFATAYNKYGERMAWKQEMVRQFFADEELLIGGEFWNFICRSERGYEIVLDEYSRNARCIVDALDRVKAAYLPGATREGDA